MKNISYKLNSTDSQLVANAAINWLLKGHQSFANDSEMIKAYAQDYTDLMVIAHQVEDYDVDYPNMEPAESKLLHKRIVEMMWDLDTIVRDQIPNIVYNRFKS